MCAQDSDLEFPANHREEQSQSSKQEARSSKSSFSDFGLQISDFAPMKFRPARMVSRWGYCLDARPGEIADQVKMPGESR